MQVILIRHGMTQGNAESRYIGITDEPLCQAGRQILRQYTAAGIYPEAVKVVTSPMLRCRETASLIYPEEAPLVVDDFRECDFGAFEGKNYRELADAPAYQQWIDSNGELPFPGGEGMKQFQERCVRAFAEVMEQLAGELPMRMFPAGELPSVAFVVHGGTIMSVMEHYAEPKGSYYDFQVKNGLGYVAEYREGRLKNVSALEECVRSI